MLIIYSTSEEHSKLQSHYRVRENPLMNEDYEWVHYMGVVTEVAHYMNLYGKDVVMSDLEKALESLKYIEEMRYDPRMHTGERDD